MNRHFCSIVGDNGDNSTDAVSHVPHESQHSKQETLHYGYLSTHSD